MSKVAKSITLDIEFWAKIEKIATRENESVSHLVRELLARGFNSKVREIELAKSEIFKNIEGARVE